MHNETSVEIGLVDIINYIRNKRLMVIAYFFVLVVIIGILVYNSKTLYSAQKDIHSSESLVIKLLSKERGEGVYFSDIVDQSHPMMKLNEKASDMRYVADIIYKHKESDFIIGENTQKYDKNTLLGRLSEKLKSCLKVTYSKDNGFLKINLTLADKDAALRIINIIADDLIEQNNEELRKEYEGQLDILQKLYDGGTSNEEKAYIDKVMLTVSLTVTAMNHQKNFGLSLSDKTPIEEKGKSASEFSILIFLAGILFFIVFVFFAVFLQKTKIQNKS